MKRLLFLIVFTFAINAGFSQQVKEKLIVKLPDGSQLNSYSVKYNKQNGAFAYEHYDTTTKLAYMITSKGNSGNFSGVNAYNAYFDKDGNVYYTAYNTVQDTINTYSLMKNTEVLGTYQYINDTWVEKNGTLYFATKTDGKTSLTMLELSSGKMTKQKPYDDVFFVYYPEQAVEGEPIGYPGFTSRGELYYIASLNGQKFVVLDGAEQKAYADIDQYYIGYDKSGEIFYIANDQGNLYDSKNSTFLVHGTKEFKKFDNIYGPIYFDAANNPIYIGANNSDLKNLYPQVLMSGNNQIGKSYSGGISAITVSPSGKIAYIGTNYIDTAHSESFIVIDGIEGAKYKTAFNLTLDANDKPVYVAELKGKQYVFRGTDKVSEGYQNIMDYKSLPGGKMYCTSYIAGDYTKGIQDVYYLHLGNDNYGPYEMVNMGDEQSGGFTTDYSGNFMFTASKLVDKKNYIYKSTVISNSGKSEAFNIIEATKLYKGKVYYAGYNTYDTKNYLSRGKFYADFQPVTKEYDFMYDYKYDEAAGVVGFVAGKGNEIYYVEVKL